MSHWILTTFHKMIRSIKKTWKVHTSRMKRKEWKWKLFGGEYMVFDVIVTEKLTKVLLYDNYDSLFCSLWAQYSFSYSFSIFEISIFQPKTNNNQIIVPSNHGGVNLRSKLILSMIRIFIENYLISNMIFTFCYSNL